MAAIVYSFAGPEAFFVYASFCICHYLLTERKGFLDLEAMQFNLIDFEKTLFSFFFFLQFRQMESW